ncbi:glycoside hydrolase superfamily [Schizothecium vesticola]|uniref:Beta-mannosidase B n=1 Tax=Schizothecium vesticola TaxID=314040 RepID=A0AA40EP89_9PEZI|nr:glycoside hydrolase superfamily [Schizothecium vesticola]
MTHNLTSNWEFRCSPASDSPEPDTPWRPATVPGEIHTELMRHGVIPDPFVDLNELEIRWVGDQKWEYRTTFPTPRDVFDAHSTASVTADLVFEGLDTFATVSLNGKVILEADNMFISHRVNVDEYLTKDKTDNAANTLEITFDSARKRGLQLVKEHFEHEFIVHQTEVSRGPVRKAQYHWGWDFGPILMTCGPWKPIRLETYICRIDSVRVDYEVDISRGEPGEISIAVESLCSLDDANLTIELLDAQDNVLQTSSSQPIPNASRHLNHPTTTHFTLPGTGLSLWYPRNYGPQTLYCIRALLSSPATTTSHTQTLGFRKAELIQTPDSLGRSFYFRINNIPIFCGGSNWIPASIFLPSLTPTSYTTLLADVAASNQTMIRVWGGGIYEHPAFYAACDALGLLAWQDFMFACASYPTHPSFLASITTEATQAILRLRQHPSLVLWCGNNEDYQLPERYPHLIYSPSDKDPSSWLRTNFPARYIYEHLLPSLVTAHHPSIPYHPSSPFGDGHSPTLLTDPTIGDIHQWDVYNGLALPYQRYALPQMGGRFVSEFGMPALPHVDTIHRFITNPKERYPGSMTLDFHNKAVGHTRRMLAYLGENFRLDLGGRDLVGFVHLSQVVQADALGWAYKSWRRRWDEERGCGGVLVWQANDVWPGTSWSVVDYYGVRKAAWYAVRRALAPVAVGVRRGVWDWTTREKDGEWKRDTGHVDPRGMREVVFDVWVVNSRVEGGVGLEWDVGVTFVGVDTGRTMRDQVYDVKLGGNGRTEVVVGERVEEAEEHFVIWVTLWVRGKKVGSDVSWPDPIKYLDLSDRGVRVEAVEEGVVEVSAEKPVKGFLFSERQGVTVSDNGFDVMPGETVRVHFTGLEAGEMLPWTFVGR